MIRAYSWTFTSVFVRAFSNGLHLLVLANILSPDEYSHVVIIFLYLNFLKIFGENGLTAAVIQTKNLYAQKLKLLNLTMLLACLIAMFSVVLFASVDSNFKLSSLNLILILSIAALFPLYGIKKAFLERNKKFKEVAIIEAISVVISVFFSCSFVWYFATAEFMVLGLLVGESIKCVAYWLNFKKIYKKPETFRGKRLNFLTILRELRYSLPLFLNNIINWLSQSIDIILLGIFFDAYVIGLYGLAKNLIFQLQSVFSTAVSTVLFPTLSSNIRSGNDPRSSFLNASYLSVAVSVPVFTFFGTNSEFIIGNLFGDDWVPAAKFFQILIFLGFFRIVGHLNGPLALSYGKTKLLLYWSTANLVSLTLVIFTISVALPEMFAVSIVLHSAVMHFLSWYVFVFRLINMDFFTWFIFPHGLSLIIIALSTLMTSVLSSSSDELIFVIVNGLAMFVVICALVFARDKVFGKLSSYNV